MLQFSSSEHAITTQQFASFKENALTNITEILTKACKRSGTTMDDSTGLSLILVSIQISITKYLFSVCN